MEIPETAQANALRDVARLGAERAEALASVERLTNSLRDATVLAVRSGAPRSRARELSKVSSDLFYAWLEGAGIEVRRRRKKMAAAPDSQGRRPLGHGASDTPEDT
ncbi:hypothetical protein QMK19_38930 [Streptomyces sp. H10-C2]|uniref:hypothetical protein n=1 Tax=unclassified Streptomyces TaxID=2593676 RepID=UPI0024BBCDC3|nr:MULTISPECIES: hypothetical protein [unclassified Streptomyces]MDJ0347151.1 hypothetical protein [Streptomyces sp. PH10-H1]MDJ0375410.1 hypothetical protein [Streptomyces sp. H10-C2]